MKTALLVIDIQVDYFPNGKWELFGMETAAQNAGKLLAAFRERNLPLFHIQHIAKNPDAPCFVAGTHGAEIHESVQPRENEKVIHKEFPNSFLRTSLLNDLHHAGIEKVVICGAMSNLCIDATTRAASDFGFECVVAHDACAATELEFLDHAIPAPEVHGSFMAGLAFGYAKVVPTSEAVALSDSKE